MVLTIFTQRSRKWTAKQFGRGEKKAQKKAPFSASN